MPLLKALILSGGAGTRFWPASREGHPKPFSKMLDGEMVTSKTYLHVKALGAEVLAAINRDYYFIIRDE